jgi:hypothetical protein
MESTREMPVRNKPALSNDEVKSYRERLPEQRNKTHGNILDQLVLAKVAETPDGFVQEGLFDERPADLSRPWKAKIPDHVKSPIGKTFDSLKEVLGTKACKCTVEVNDLINGKFPKKPLGVAIDLIKNRQGCYSVLSYKNPIVGDGCKPQWVREIDLITKFNDIQCGCFRSAEPYLSYIQLTNENSYTHFHADFANASPVLAVIKGHKTFFIIPFSPENNSNMRQWASYQKRKVDAEEEKYEEYIPREEQCWLPDVKDIAECYRVDVKEGEIIYLPSGYIHAVYSPLDCMVLSGNIVTTLNFDWSVHIYWRDLTDAHDELGISNNPKIHRKTVGICRCEEKTGHRFMDHQLSFVVLRKIARREISYDGSFCNTVRC